MIFVLITLLFMSNSDIFNQEHKNCNQRNISSKSDSLSLIYQWEAKLWHGTSKSVTFKTHIDSDVASVKKTIKSLRPSTDFSNSTLKFLGKNPKAKHFKIKEIIIDSFKIISKDVLIVTKSLLDYGKPDVHSFSDYFFKNFAEYIIKDANNYIFNKLGKKQIDLYSYDNIDNTSSAYTNFFHLKKTNFDEAGLIQEYINSLQYKTVDYNYKFKILGDDSMFLKDLSLKNFDVIQYFTINFIILYNH